MQQSCSHALLFLYLNDTGLGREIGTDLKFGMSTVFFNGRNRKMFIVHCRCEGEVFFSFPVVERHRLGERDWR